MNTLMAVTVIITSCISTVQGVDCDIEIMCYGFNANGQSGYLKINNNVVATWTSDTAGSGNARRKRQLNLVDGWHIFALTTACEVSDRVHLSTSASVGNEYLVDFNNFVQAQPQGSWILGCSAGGTDPVEGDTQLQTETLNVFRAMGVDTNVTNAIANFNTGFLLTSEAALIFAIQKGFPEQSRWRIIDTTSTGAQSASLVADNVLQTTVTIDWFCGIPPMAGFELYEEFDDSGSSYSARDTYIVTNTPVNSLSSPSGCTLKGWEYIPNAANENGPGMKFGFVSKETDGSYTLRGEQSVVSSGSSNHRQFICATSNFPAVQDGDMYGVWYDTPGNGRSVIRKTYDQTLGVYPYPCGRTATSLDLDPVAHSSSNTFPITTSDQVFQSLAMRPIFDDNFVLTCPCNEAGDCNSHDDKMQCVAGKCACMTDYSYNRASNRCIRDGDLTQMESATARLASVQTGSAQDILDSNKVGNLVDGTCVTTNPSLGPWLVIDLNMVADVYAVQVTTPNPTVGYVEFIRDTPPTRYRIASGAASIDLPQGFTLSDVDRIRLVGELAWQFYENAGFSGQSVVVSTAGEYTENTFPATFGFAIGSLRLLNDLGKIKVKGNANFEGHCVDKNDQDELVLNSACSSSFYSDDTQFVHLTTGKAIFNDGGNLVVSVTSATDFQTEDINGDGNVGIDMEDLADPLDPAKIHVQNSPTECWTTTSGSSNNLAVSSTGSDCLTFVFEPDYAIWEQAWEAKEHIIDGSYCGEDDDSAVFGVGYLTRPCAEILDYHPSGSEGPPEILYVDKEKIQFTNKDTSHTDWCRNHHGRVFYQTSETGLHDFRIGVADAYDELADIDTTTFPTCASYVGNVKNEKPLLVNCTTIHQGRYVAIYIPHTEDMEQLLLCDVQVFGRPASSCTENNGGCEHNCVPGQLLGDIECRCYDEGYVLNADGYHCDDVNECLSWNVCDNDTFATCRNEEPGFSCVCDPSADDVIQFDYDLKRCSIPQEMRNTDTTDNLCSYNNGNCSDMCNPGENVYQYNCSCDESEMDKFLEADGKTCAPLDRCNETNDCDSDPNGLAYCIDQDLGYTCGCQHANRGIFWDTAEKKCTTGGTPDTLCRYAETCESTCNPFTLPSTETIPSPIFNYTCSCEDGYALDSDERSCSDINECDENPGICTGDVAGSCNNSPGGYTCTCPTGYALSRADGGCRDINECDTNNGGCFQSCNNNMGSYQCGCAVGFEGPNCDDINECNDEARHHCQDLCINTVGSYECGCQTGYVILDNGTCIDNNECEVNNGGCETTCINSPGSFECSCDSGYELTDGTQCVNIDECATGEALCDRECVDTDGSYQCLCPEPGRVLDPTNNSSCININECETSSRGNCSDICVDTDGSYYCDCNTGRVRLSDGLTCTDVDPCIGVNCDGECQPHENSDGNIVAQCTCPAGYTLNANGLTCDDINECATGTSMCEQDCDNQRGSFVCRCHSGYTLNPDGITCQDINECASFFLNPCQQICVNQPGTYLCGCYSGYVVNPFFPNRCSIVVITIILILPIDFFFFTGGAVSSTTTFVLVQIRIYLSSIIGTGRIRNTGLRLRPGSVIVELEAEYTDPLTDSGFAREAVMLAEALQGKTYNGSNDTVSEPPTNIQVAAVNEMTREETLVNVSLDNVCFLWEDISYCQNGSECMVGDDNLPYCLCEEGYTGDQCNELITTEEPDEEVSGLTGTDVILLSVFITLLVVLTIIIIFYLVYRSQAGSYISSRYSRSTQYTSEGRSYADRGEPSRWWQNLPVAASVPYQSRGYAHQGAPRRRTSRESWSRSESGEDRLSRWPAYRAYGIASRFTGSSPASRFSWGLRTERY